MKKQFRIFALTLAVVVLAASFAGCGSSASSAASSTPAASSSAQGGKITIFQQDTRFLAKKRPPQINTRTHNGSPQDAVTSASAVRTLLSRQK